MQKKLLLSLVCTVPAALPALADVALTVPDVNSWNATGITVDNVKVEGTTITCTLGHGIVYQKVEGLPAGKYKISFGNLKNAQFNVDGATVTYDEDKNGGTFELSAKGDITINVSAVDPTAGFGFTDGVITFVEDFTQKAADFQELLDKAEEIVKLADQNASQTLKNEQAAIEKQFAAINTVITALKEADNTPSGAAIPVSALVEIYSASKVESFEELFAKLTNDIAVYTEAVAAWNDKAEADNEVYNIKTTNSDNLAALQDAIKELLGDETSGVEGLIKAISADGVRDEVSEANLPGAEALKAEIEAFRTSVEAAFDGAAAIVDTEEFSAKIEGFKESLAAKQAKFENDTEAYEIFGKIQAVYKELNPDGTYLDATAEITGITDESAYGEKPDVYAGKKTEWLEELRAIYTPIKKPETFVGVVAEWGEAGYREKITEAKAQMEKVAADAIAYAKTQNDYYLEGRKLYEDKDNGWNAKLADYETRISDALPAELTAAYQKLLDAAEKAINDFKAYLDDTYNNQLQGGLKGAGYDTAVQAVSDAFADVEEFLSGDGNSGYGAVSVLVADLAQLKEENVKKFVGLEIKDTAKFEDSYNAIQAAIDVIIEGMNKDENHKADATQVENARKALDDLDEASNRFFEAFEFAHKELDDARTNLAAFKTAILGKYCAETGGNYTEEDVKNDVTYGELDVKLNGTVKGTESVKGFEQQYQDAADAVGQESLNQAVTLASDISDFATEINDAKAQWLLDATEANIQFAKERLAEINTFMTAHAPELETSVKLGEIGEALNKLDKSQLATADKAVETQLKAMADLYVSITNYEAVNDVLKQIATNAGKATEANEYTTGLTAHKYYDGIIKDNSNTEDILKELQTAFNGDGITEAVRDKWKAVADERNSVLKNLPDAIRNNQNSYSDLIARSGDVRNYVQGILNNIVNGNYEDLITEWKTQLEDLLNNTLIAIDVEVGEAYNEGEAFTKKESLNKQYDDIIAKADEIAGSFEAGYDAKIISANSALNSDNSEWGLVDTQLYDEYLKAVRLYTFYKYNLVEDAGYADTMADANLVENYAQIYDFLTRRQQLNSDIQALIGKANEAKEYLPESEQYKDEYEALVNTQLSELASLKAMYADLVSVADAAAVAYYNDKVGSYNDLVTNVKNELTAAGFTTAEAEAAVKSVTEILANAQDFLDNTTNTKGETINGIAANYFSKIGEQDAIVATAALNKWNSTYDLSVNGRAGKDATETEPAVEAIASVKELRSTLVENGGTKEQLDEFDDIVAAMDALNTSALKDKTLIDNLQSYISDLGDYRGKLEKMAKDASDNTQYAELWAGYMEDYAAMQELVDELNAYIGELILQKDVDVSDLDYMLITLKTMIGEKPNAGVAESNFKTDVELKKADIEKAVEDKMAAANLAAVETLNIWIENTKAAYNTAVANGKIAQEVLTAASATIQNLSDEAANLMADLSGDQGFKGDFPAVVNGYINTAIETYTSLIPDTAAGELEAVKAELGKVKDEIAAEIENSRNGLEDLVRAYYGLDEDAELDADQATVLEYLHNDMDPKYDELLAALEDIQGEWEAAGSTLLVNSYIYKDKLNTEVGDKIDDVEGEAPAILADIIKAKINTETFNALVADYEELSELLFNVKTYVENWGCLPAFGREIGSLESTLSALYDAICKEAAETNLTVNSTFESVFRAVYDEDLTSGSTLESRIKAVGGQAAAMQTENLMNSSRDAWLEAYDMLVGRYFVNNSALVSAKNGMAITWNNAVDGYVNPEGIYVPGFYTGGYYDLAFASYDNIDLYLGWIDAFNSVIEGSKKLIEDAEGQEYTPGDVVNRDGEVTSQDVMQLVTWVGNGVSYEELAASEETAWQALAADIDLDKHLYINDINADIQLMLGNFNVLPNPADNPNVFKKPAAVSNDAACSLAYLGNVDGADRYAVVLNNPTAFIGAQLDIKLPVGMTLVGVSATDRTRAHEVMTFEHDVYTSRVVVFSMDNAEIAGNSGAFLYIDVQGHGSLSLSDVLFSDSEFHLHGAGNPGTSGIIDAVIEGAGAVKDAIYDAAGRMYDRVQRGVNIIRHSDGTVTKELRK